MAETRSSKCEELLIFDGGTGREIERQGGPFRQPEWSALALYEDPAIVQRVHESYIDAGATAITCNSYAIVPFHIGEERYKKDSKRLLKLSVDLAEKAAGSRRPDVKIIGSIPPICGSYEPDKFNEETAAPILADFLDAYQDRVDILMLETIGSIHEARFYLESIRERDSKIPVWLSFCVECKYGENQPLLLTHDRLEDAVKELRKADLLHNVEAMLVNCCDLRLVTDSVKELRSCLPPKHRIGVYPNAFSVPPPDSANHTLRQVDFNITPEVVKEKAKEWVAEGATVLGGCCGAGPEHIRALATLKTEM